MRFTLRTYVYCVEKNAITHWNLTYPPFNSTKLRNYAIHLQARQETDVSKPRAGLTGFNRAVGKTIFINGGGVI